MGKNQGKKQSYRVTWSRLLLQVLIIQSLLIKSSHPNSELFEVISTWNKLLLTKPNVLTRQGQRLKLLETAPLPMQTQRLRNFSKVSNTLVSTDRNDANWNFNEVDYKNYHPATSVAHKTGLPFNKDLHCLAHVGGLALKGLKLFGIGAIKALILFKLLAFLSVLQVFIPRPVLLVNVPGPSSSMSQIVTEIPVTSTTTTATPITLPPITIPPTLPPVPDPGPVVVVTCPPCFGKRRALGFGDGGGRSPDRLMMMTTTNNLTAYLSTTESLALRNNSTPASPTGTESLIYFMEQERCIERVVCEAKFEHSGIYAGRKRKDHVANILQTVMLNSINQSRMLGRMIFEDDAANDKHEPTLIQSGNYNAHPSLRCQLYECKNFNKIRDYLEISH